MLPNPSRLKSLDSELSPVLTTPPPVEPNTVLVLMSVPEMMLSSNLVVLRRPRAISATSPPSTARTPTPIAHNGVPPMMPSKKPGSAAGAFAGAFATGAFAGSVDFGGAGAVTGAGVGVTAVVVDGEVLEAGSVVFAGSGALVGAG